MCEENKGNCESCSDKGTCGICMMSKGEKCGMCGMNMHKFRIMKKIFYLLLLVIVFCFGTQLGELRTISKIYRSEGLRGRMMQNQDFGYRVWDLNDNSAVTPTPQAPTPKQ